MKKIFNIYLVFLFICIQSVGFGKASKSLPAEEDTFYLANGNKFSGKIANVTDDKVTFNVERGERIIPNTFNKENVLVAFNSNGNYLVISTLSTDLDVAQQQIDDFNNVPIRESGLDLLIKAAPLKVVPCIISYESDALINYQIPSGGAGSINKSELVVVLYKDGRHQFVMDPTESGDLLKNASVYIESYAKKSPEVVAGPSSVSVPVSAPTPAPVQENIPTPTSQPQTKSTDAQPQMTKEQRQEKDGNNQFVMNPNETRDLPKNANENRENYSNKSPMVVVVVSNPSPSNVTVPAPTPALVQQDITTPSTELQTTSNYTQPQITEEERQEYKTKAVNKVEEFGIYLGIITDKSSASSDRDKAIEEAAKLFLPEAVIEVSSANRGGTRKYKVREYLTRVKLLPYSSAKVEWSEIQYVKDLRQEADGNYYGTITGQQTFTGFGGKNGENVMYSDKTKKNVRVKLQAYQKTIDGRDDVNWQLYLGNIGVANK